MIRKQNYMLLNIIKKFIHFIIFTFLLTNIKSSAQHTTGKIFIEGEADGADLLDLPLSKFDYDFDTFSSGFNPKKDTIDLLNRPEELIGIKEKDLEIDYSIIFNLND